MGGPPPKFTKKNRLQTDEERVSLEFTVVSKLNSRKESNILDVLSALSSEKVPPGHFSHEVFHGLTAGIIKQAYQSALQEECSGFL